MGVGEAMATRQRERFSLRRYWVPALYLLGAVGLLYVLAPRQSHFHYEFQQGKVWVYPMLRAPFDYPLYLSAKEQAQAQREVSQRVLPVFRLDTAVRGEVKRAISAQCEAAWRETRAASRPLPRSAEAALLDGLRAAVDNTLDYLYTCGVVSSGQVLQTSTNGEFAVLRSHVSYETQLRDVFTPQNASGFLVGALQRADTTRAGDAMWRTMDFSNRLVVNLSYDSLLTRQLREEKLRTIAHAEGVVHAGERIIDQGDVVTSESYRKLVSLQREIQKRQYSGWRRAGNEVGIFLSLSLVFLFYFCFFLWYRPGVLKEGRSFLFLVLQITTLVAVAYLCIRFAPQFLYAVPFLVVPFLTKSFFDGRVGLVTHLTMIFLVALFTSNSFDFMTLNLAAGVVALFSIRTIYRRGKLFVSVCCTLLTLVVVHALTALLHEGSVSSITAFDVGLFMVHSFFTLAVHPLMYPLERMFGFVSEATLMELCDVNQPLLRELSERAPGSFQHSMQVATLAEAAVTEIGGNSLLTRAGALYHDLGKMVHPEFFTENQSAGMKSPYADLTEEESSRKIIQHVVDGVEIARKHRLPEQVIAFIRTHHGTTQTAYFYRMYRAKHPQEEDPKARFSYPGPRPHSKETVVLMMADSIEAASRSLNPFTKDALQSMVEAIVERQQTLEQYNDSEITIHDIETVKRVFVQKLLTMNHTRIAYPPDPDAKK